MPPPHACDIHEPNDKGALTMSERKKLEMKLTDTDDMKFKAPLHAYLSTIPTENPDEPRYIVGHKDLGISVQADSLKAASIEFKERFCELASELYYKSQYMPLSGKERQKMNIVLRVCDIQ